MSISDLVLPSAPPCSAELALVSLRATVSYYSAYPVSKALNIPISRVTVNVS